MTSAEGITTEKVAEDIEDVVEVPELPERFSVRDEGSANWVVRQIVERRAYAKRCAEWCEREQRRAQREEEFFLFRFGNQLIDFARRKIEEQRGRRKSVNLPAGSLGFRKAPSRIAVTDEPLVIAWAKLHKPELVVVSEHLDKRAFNHMVESTGEIPGVGVEIEPEREKFFVK